MQKLTTFLMFEGHAEAAVNFYCSLFPGSGIDHLMRNPDGTVLHCIFRMDGQQFMAIDSAVHHGFGFTPAMSIYVTCQTEPEIDELFEKLSQGGKILMPLTSYPFSKKYAWLADQFGVAWQISLSNGS